VTLSQKTKSKFSCASKDTIKKVKRQTKELEDLFVNHVSDNGVETCN
jgi:hypothetical protein